MAATARDGGGYAERESLIDRSLCVNERERKSQGKAKTVASQRLPASEKRQHHVGSGYPAPVPAHSILEIIFLFLFLLFWFWYN